MATQAATLGIESAAKAEHSKSGHGLGPVEEDEAAGLSAPSSPPVELDDDEEEADPEAVCSPPPVEVGSVAPPPVDDSTESLPVESESAAPPPAEDDEDVSTESPPVESGSVAPPSLPEDESAESPPVDEGTGGGWTTVKAAGVAGSSARRPGPMGIIVHEAAPSGASAATVSVTV